MLIHIFNIKWVVDDEDTDEEYAEPNLPTDVYAEVPDVYSTGSEDIDEYLSNLLSDTYGFLHEGFNYLEVKKDEII